MAEVNGVRVVIMEVDGDLKQMTKMLKELTLDQSKPTLAILGSREGGGKLMVATTEGTVASEKFNAVDILRAISSHINGGGGGRPTFCSRWRLKPRWTACCVGSCQGTHRCLSAPTSNPETALDIASLGESHSN